MAISTVAGGSEAEHSVSLLDVIATQRRVELTAIADTKPASGGCKDTQNCQQLQAL